MATAVILPKMGQSVESCIITEWHKKPGDAVTAGEPLYEYETDKSAFTENAEVDGILLAVFYEADSDVPCLETIAVIGAEGEDYSALIPAGAGSAAPSAAESAAAPAAAAPAAPAAPSAPEAEAAGSFGGPISPRAKALAEKLHINTDLVSGTGPNGRIIENDILNYKPNGSGFGGRYTDEEAAALLESVAEAEYEDVKHSKTRKVIAKNMLNSLATIAQLTHNSSCDATQLNAMRAAIKKAKDRGCPNATLNDMLLYAVSRVILNHKELNAHYYDDCLRVFNNVHLGIATDTPRGLLVPTLFNANKLGLFEIATESKKLITATREGKLSPDYLKGASFTVTNLGSLGIESFTPIINPPQTGILGVDTVVDRIRMSKNSFTVYPAMGLSLTYDHRALDGAPASRFLKELCDTLTNFIDFYKSQEDNQYELDI